MRDAIDGLVKLIKGAAAGSGGGGWGNIPKGTRGGQRKRVGGKWRYRYPDGSGGWQSSPRKGGKRKAKAKAKSGAGKWTSPEQARARGAAAHAEGIQASAQDREFMARTPFDLKVGGTMPYLDAWSEGWHAANRKANDESPEGRKVDADMARQGLENRLWSALPQHNQSVSADGKRAIAVTDTKIKLSDLSAEDLKAKVEQFEGFVKKRPANLLAQKKRAKLADAAWKKEHPDFRSTIDGVKHIMLPDPTTGATVLIPVNQLTDFQLMKVVTAGNEAEAASFIDPHNPSDGERARIQDTEAKLYEYERDYDNSVQWPVKYEAYRALVTAIEVADKKFGPGHPVVPPGLRDKAQEMRATFDRRTEEARVRLANQREREALKGSVTLDDYKGVTIVSPSKAMIEMTGEAQGARASNPIHERLSAMMEQYVNYLSPDWTADHHEEAARQLRAYGRKFKGTPAVREAARSLAFEHAQKGLAKTRAAADRERSGKGGLRELQEGTGKRMAREAGMIAGVESTSVLTHDDGTQELSLTVDKTLPQGNIDNIMNAVAATLVGSKDNIVVRQGSGVQRGNISVFVQPSKAAKAIAEQNAKQKKLDAPGADVRGTEAHGAAKPFESNIPKTRKEKAALSKVVLGKHTDAINEAFGALHDFRNKSIGQDSAGHCARDPRRHGRRGTDDSGRPQSAQKRAESAPQSGSGPLPEHESTAVQEAAQ